MALGPSLNVLAVNCGSSTLKFRLQSTYKEDPIPARSEILAAGIIERIGEKAVLKAGLQGEAVERAELEVSGHGQAMELALALLAEKRLVIHGLGHRVVHGGERFAEPVRIDDEALSEIEELEALAPLHNSRAVAAIRTAQARLGREVPQVAVFDTAFHRTLPDRAGLYAIDLDLARRLKVRRYGFHGLAHRYMVERYAAITGTPLRQVTIITLQLGNGCSATAVSGGRSADTSMGFTPLEGLVMGTRSGDADPSLAGFLARAGGLPVNEVEDWLNTRSGLLGVSGRSQDMRELLAARASGDARAALAVEMFCYRARKYIGAYLAALGGAKAIVFGGGIGENAPEVRAEICRGMEWCGLELAPEGNRAAVGSEARISKEGSALAAYVLPVQEEELLVSDAMRLLWEGNRR